MDEHRVGLKPILRRVWAKRGERPVVEVYPRYEWLWLYGFAEPATGRTSFWLCDQINVESFTAILGGFARERGIGPERPALLVLDQAGWHVSERVEWPEGIEPVFLPPYSPELQPAERLWEVTDAPLFNRVPGSLAELEAALSAQCCRLAEEPERLRSRLRYHWWPVPHPN